MKLIKVIIEDFKSISREEIELNNLTCLVGQNECGKTNILEAISYLDPKMRLLDLKLTNKNSKRYENGQLPLIQGFFQDKKEDILEEIFEEFTETETVKINKNWILKIEINSSILSDIIVYLINKESEQNLKILFTDQGRYELFLNEILNNYIPKIEIFQSDELSISPINANEIVEENASATSFLRLLSLGGIENFQEILSDPERGLDKLNLANDRINDIFSGFYSQDKSIKIELGSIEKKQLTASLKANG